MRNLNPKLVSIVIVNYNGWGYLKKLLLSIEKNSYSDFEVVVVDNGSKKSNYKKLKEAQKRKSWLKVIYLHKNFGPATARNIGVKNSVGQYFAFLDNDTQVDSRWAKNAINYFQSNPKVGIIQCKLLLASDHSKIDYVGEYLGSNGFLVQECPAGTTDKGQFNKPKKILAAKSAGMFITRDAFEKAGGFDDDYFIYVEETDLGWRSWLAGFEAHFLPSSIVYHHFGTSTVILGQAKAGNLAKYHGPKNYLATLYKNLPKKLLFKTFSTHLLLWFSLIIYRFFTLKPKDSYYMLKGVVYFFANFRRVSHKRQKIQSNKAKKVDEKIERLVVKRPLWYFINKATKKQKVGNATTGHKVNSCYT